MTFNRTPARDGRAASGVAERPVVPPTPGNSGRGKGPRFKVNAISGRQPGDWREPHLSEGWDAADGVAHQSEDLARLSLLRACSQTRSIVATSWVSPTTAAVLTAAQAGGPTARASPISTRTAPIDGWTNWRKSSGTRRISPNRFDACTYLNRMASKGRWASLA